MLGVAELAAEEAAGALEDEAVAPELLLELLLQAATASARAKTSAGARVIRRAKSLNRMTRLLSLGRMCG